MARKGYGRNSSLVNITTHADDNTSPVGSNEWNENPKTDGIFGLTKSAQTISGNNNIVVTDSYIEITTADSASGGSNDGIYTLSAGTDSLSATNYASDSASSISEGDLIYVVKAASQATTSLVHQQGGTGGAGKITTLTGENKELSATVPTILMARTIGSVLEWVEYGGGAVADASIDNTKLAVMAANTIKVRNANSSGAPSDIALATTQILIGNGTGFTAAALSGDVAMDNTGAVTVGTLNQNTAGSAATLTTPRAIGGVDFNGSAPINLPGVNAAGNQDTSGNSATATEATNVTAVANNSTNETVYPTFVDGATGTQGLETDTGLNYNPSTGLLSAVGLTLSGDLTVNGTNTILNTATLEVEDKDIFLAKVSSPSNTTANGAGIIIEAGSDTDKSILWDSTNSNFTSTEHVNIATGKKFKINNVDTLTATALGTNVVGSSLTSVGTIGTGTWQGDAVAQAYIGADAINGDKIVDDSIDSEHIIDGSIDLAHLSVDSVNGTKIADDSIDSEHIIDASIDVAHLSAGAKKEFIMISLSDEETDLETGTNKAIFQMPYAFTITDIRATVGTAPVGSTLTVDINKSGQSILTTKLTIDASENTSTSAATAHVIASGDTAFADGAIVAFDIDQVGSSTAGKGLKVTLIGYQT
mgnify:CR=1 FL=1